jgi:hypothetical protein
MAVWYSLWSFGILFPLGMFGPRKILQPCSPKLGRSIIENYFTCCAEKLPSLGRTLHVPEQSFVLRTGLGKKVRN